MTKKIQSTRLHLNTGKAIHRLELWSANPWRRYSLFLVILLTGFLLGSSIGMISGALSLMDPVGAFFTVLIIELMIKIRRSQPSQNRLPIAINLVDMARIGFLYGLLLEGFKLL